MSTQRYISTSFWDDEWIHRLDPSEKLLYMYFMTNTLTNIAGVYKIAVERISYDTGFNENTIQHIFEKFEKSGKVHRKGEYIAIPSWPKHQKWQSKESIRNGIVKILNDFDDEILNWLFLIGYRFDFSLTRYHVGTKGGSTPHQPPMTPPSTDSDQHQPTYLNSDSDIDMNSDIDTDRDASPENPASPFFSISPQKTCIRTNDGSTRINALREIWNSLGLPEMRRTTAVFYPNEMTECLATVSVYSDAEIEEAMKNYHRIITEPDFEIQPQFQYKTFQSFMGKGVERFNANAKPFEAYKKRTQPTSNKKQGMITNLDNIDFDNITF